MLGLTTSAQVCAYCLSLLLHFWVDLSDAIQVLITSIDKLAIEYSDR